MMAVARELLEALAAEAPKPEPQTRSAAASASPASGEYRSRLMVERWLMDKGIGYRVSDKPDSEGRTVYVLEACPFDASHGRDACILQEGDGRMSAQCFHNSCNGRGWQKFKEKIGSPGPEHYDPPFSGPIYRPRTFIQSVTEAGNPHKTPRRPPRTSSTGVGSAERSGAKNHRDFHGENGEERHASTTGDGTAKGPGEGNVRLAQADPLADGRRVAGPARPGHAAPAFGLPRPARKAVSDSSHAARVGNMTRPGTTSPGAVAFHISHSGGIESGEPAAPQVAQ
jgi:hypothetical protein